MARVFDITAASETVRLDAHGAGEISFTVSNVSGKPIRGRAYVTPQDPAMKPWLSLAGAAERDFPVAGTQQYTAKVAVPAGSKPGKYNFRLDLSSVQNPDEDSAQGPNVAVAVTLAPPPPPPQWIKWAILAAILVLVVGGLLIWLLPGGSTPVPDLTGKTLAEADALLTQSHFKVGDIENVITDNAKVDTILRQDPKPPAKAAPQSAVNLAVGVALVAIPPLRNHPYTEAVKALKDVKLDLGKVTNINQIGVQTPGLVLDSNPKEGNTVKSHQTIDLVIQQDTVTVPNVVGQPYGGAIGMIVAANLKLGGITGNIYEQIGMTMAPVARVVDQSPKPGQAAVGTPVTLTFPGAPVVINPRIFMAIPRAEMAVPIRKP